MRHAYTDRLAALGQEVERRFQMNKPLWRGNRLDLELALILQPRKGQGLVEYAIMILLIAIVVVVALGNFGTAVSGLFDVGTNAFP